MTERLELYPLRFHPRTVAKPWGGDAIARAFGRPRTEPRAGPTGESWELSDLDGEASVVADGPLAGRTLRELIEDAPRALLGEALRIAPDGRFPILVKYIDVRGRLSLQVHPDDDDARRLEGLPRGKSECWWVVDSDPDGFVLLGPDRPIEPAAMRAALEEGAPEAFLRKVTPTRGDVVDIPAGQLHSAGGGLLLLEVQDACGITYRVHDWGQLGTDGRPRDLHLDRAFEVARLDGDLDGLIRPATDGSGLLVRSRRFDLHLLRGEPGEALALAASGGSPSIYALLEGRAIVEGEGPGGERPCGPGDVLLFPVGLGAHQLRPIVASDALTVVVTTLRGNE